MAKPKFTLTTDLVKIEPEPSIPEVILEKAVSNVPAPEKTKIVEREALNFKIPRELKKEFHLWCITNGKTMTEALEQAMEKLIKE